MKYSLNNNNVSIMKKFNLKALVSLMIVVLLLSGCASIKKMKKNADLIKWNVTPEVLETHAGQVKVAVDGQIPAKYFAKKANLVITPVVKYEGGEVAYPEIRLQGEKVKANNAVITYKPGGNFSIKGAIPYDAAMKMSALQIRCTAYQGVKSLDFEPVKIADGVIATSELVNKVGEPVIGKIREKNTTGKYNPAIDEFQRVVPDSRSADLLFLINKADVRKEEKAKAGVTDFEGYATDAISNDRKKLKELEIAAYASPDGSLELNDKLSQKREASAREYFKKELDNKKLVAEIKSKYTAEDWDGFKKLMESSKIQDKELILRVLSMYSDPEVREKEIKNLSQAFTAVADQILPQLRRAQFSANIDLIGYSDVELVDLANKSPEKLNQAELLQAAILSEDNAQKAKFYTSFTKQFPDDWRGFNNLGMVQVWTGDLEAASNNFDKADKLNPNNPIIQNNLGVAALYKGDANKAKELFAAASGVGAAVDHNMGIVSILRAEYEKAVKYFGESTTANAGLAKILAGDNNGALKTLEACDKNCPMASYLKAVVGARTGKESLLLESLEGACKIDPKLKAAAKTDLEFAKYFENPKFKAIVE